MLYAPCKISPQKHVKGFSKLLGLWEEEGEEEANGGCHDGAYWGFATKERKDHENKNNGAVAIHNALEFKGIVTREESKNNFLAIEWTNREEIEDSE